MGQPSRLKALVIGGGIGGLTTAIALRRAGVDATVFERRSELEQAQFGSGFFLWSNAISALKQLDLADGVIAAGTPIEYFKEYTSSGKVIAVWPVGEITREIGVPSVCVSRAALHPILTGALGDGVLQLSAACTGFSQDADGVVARFDGGREERGDILIGADGSRSPIRTQVRGKSDPRYAGYTAWRAIIPFAHGSAPEDTFNETWGRGSRFIHYPVGGGHHYLSGFLTVGKDFPDPPEGRKALMLKHFADWRDPIRALIEATPEEEFHRTEIYGHFPFRRWGEGRVTLLGDAAHPMTPNLGQGACQAIEDAVVLAKCLTAGDAGADVAAALRAYEAARKSRTASMVMRAWGIGLTGRMKNPVAVMLRDRISKVMFNTVALKQQRQDMAYQV